MSQKARKTKLQGVDINRRQLIAGALTVGASAGLGLVALNAQAAPVVEKEPAAGPDGYRETEHIRRYYRAAREI